MASCKQTRSLNQAVTSRKLCPLRFVRHSLVIARSSRSSGTVRLPVSTRQLLGLSPDVVTPDDIVTQHEALSQMPVEEGYTEALSSGRKQLLDSLADNLLSGGSMEDQLEVHAAAMPSVLSLMNEVGLCSTVLQYGQQAMRNWEVRSSHKRDILLAMALAHCGLAAEDLAATPPKVLEGCSHLEAALQLLREGGMPPLAPGLTVDAQAALQRFQQDYLLALLQAQISPELMRRRQQAITQLRTLLPTSAKRPLPPPTTSPPTSATPATSPATVSEATTSTTTSATGAAAATAQPAQAAAPPAASAKYAFQIFQALTPQEILSVHSWDAVAAVSPPPSWLSSDVARLCALAHLEQALRQRRPQPAVTALQLLALIPDSGEVLVERAICQLLLACPQDAWALLLQAEASSLADPDASTAGPEGSSPQLLEQSAATYVRSMQGKSEGASPASPAAFTAPPVGQAGVTSPGSGTVEAMPLYGLVLWAQQWIQQAALPSLRPPPSGPITADLLDYFSALRPATFLKLPGSYSSDTIAATLAGITACCSRLNPQTSQLLSNLEILIEQPALEASMSAPSPRSPSPRSKSLAPPQLPTAAAATSAAADSAANTSAAEAVSTRAPPQRNLSRGRMPTKPSSSRTTSPSGAPSALFSSIEDAAEEEVVAWRKPPNFQLTQQLQRSLAAAALLTLVGVGGFLAVIFRFPAARNAVHQATPGISTAVMVVEDTLQQQQAGQQLPLGARGEEAGAASRLDKTSAQQVVDSWLAARSAAMGPRHHVKGLQQLLAEPLLGKELQKVQNFKEAGRFVRYRDQEFEVLSVESAGPSPKQPAASSSSKATAAAAGSEQLVVQTRSAAKASRAAAAASSQVDNVVVVVKAYEQVSLYGRDGSVAEAPGSSYYCQLTLQPGPADLDGSGGSRGAGGQVWRVAECRLTLMA